MSDFQSTLDSVVSSLKEGLGKNLYSCCLYGSAVRGDAIEGVSDINLLIVLNESNAEAHLTIGKLIGDNREIDPFVLGWRGFERSVRAFAPKFLSIRRDYRVLYGADPLKDVQVDQKLERFLCEQALRNLRLRMAHAFITRARNRAYPAFLSRCVTPFFLRLSEALRLEGKTVPQEMSSRIPVIREQFGMDERLLEDLVALKKNPRRLSDEEIIAWHKRFFPAVDRALTWIEAKWPQ